MGEREAMVVIIIIVMLVTACSICSTVALERINSNTAIAIKKSQESLECSNKILKG